MQMKIRNEVISLENIDKETTMAKRILNSIILASSLILIIGSCKADSDLVSFGGIRIETTLQNSDTCGQGEYGRKCADCSTILFCPTGSKFPCPSNIPYCSNGTCVKSIAPGDCNVGLDSVCPFGSSDAYYPDVKSCYTYYYCDSNGFGTDAYTCPINFPFDFASQSCKRGAACGNFNCYNKNVAINSAAPRLAVYCNDNKIVDGSYTVCPEDQQLDETALECKVKCTKEGNIAHESDTNKYYRCLPSGPWGTLVQTEVKCPGTQTFNKTEKKCQ